MAEKEDESTNESIKLESEEKKFTEDMKKYTYLIENLIENEENNLTKLYEDFRKIHEWVKKEVNNQENTSLKNAALKQQILEKCTQLRTDAEKNIILIDTIQKSTKNEELTDSKKINIKINMRQSYENQKDLDKIVHYPKDIAALIKQVISAIQESENLAEKDIDVGLKTKRLLEGFMEHTKKIHESLDKIIEAITRGEELASILKEIDIVLGEIDQEISNFRNLDKLERIHLQLLLKIFKDEELALEKEKKLDHAQEEFDEDKGYSEDQDGTVIIDES